MASHLIMTVSHIVINPYGHLDQKWGFSVDNVAFLSSVGIIILLYI